MATRKSDTPLVVVGGIYRERCARPFWDEVFGSGGRAASAIARVGGRAELRAYADPAVQEAFEVRSALEAIKFKPVAIKASPIFSYLHGLDTPRVYLPECDQAPIRVSAANVLRFGLIEGDAIVNADRAVYDPQSASDPTSFAANGSKATHLALVLNHSEASALAGLPAEPVRNLAKALQRQEKAKVVVIKQGARGALVLEGTKFHEVPAYRSDTVWKIGSGDVFAAHFAHRWLTEHRSASMSARLASKAVAFYCETKGMPSQQQLEARVATPIRPAPKPRRASQPKVYLAGPFFTLAELWMIEQARDILLDMQLSVFSPYHDVGHGSAEDVVEEDLKAIESADVIFAVADGMDSGTLYEVGYARAKGKPVVVYCENETSEAKKMMQGSGCVLCSDFVTAVYQTLWTACEA